MADKVPPNPNDAMMQLLNNINQKLDELGTRVVRLEQPPGPAPIRNLNPNQEGQEQQPNRDDEPPDPDPQVQHQRQREPNNRGRIRDENLISEIKIIPPTFAGRADPEGYLAWERRLEHIFDVYRYNEAKKIALAQAQLMEHAITWWDREVAKRRRLHLGPILTWNDVKTYLRRRYVPPNYTRELQKRFRKLFQGPKMVEEYFEEFEMLKNILELGDDEEALMAQFIDGLQENISRKVER